MTDEYFRPIRGWEDRYEISNHGNVRSIPRTFIRRNGWRYTVRERILKPQRVRPDSDMLKVTLAADGQRRCKLVHLLLREAWSTPTATPTPKGDKQS